MLVYVRARVGCPEAMVTESYGRFRIYRYLTERCYMHLVVLSAALLQNTDMPSRWLSVFEVGEWAVSQRSNSERGRKDNRVKEHTG